MVLACKIKRLNTVARADRVVTVGFQQIVEELHVELVVLHDQDGLGHSPNPSAPPAPTFPSDRPMRSAAAEPAGFDRVTVAHSIRIFRPEYQPPVASRRPYE